ncbi:ketoacyl-ACP synthase III [Rhodomicrobium vannielii ATCC 17100]|uniref:Beta-ketoacyl-[acyl-carrier-protein] synthase III n=1 Tax=Rhodomicrobium udaipurense TaxID=1202716 RepID=A0A8I1GGY1_9HYPH|nr:beta-ketoacyl-ACP synthase III [Rhodomicrobium udaipurense]KAI94806.1 3-oxoacyl-ACP synthase [Rhodomicrobium udaipurense JA643]MBJ7534234.1 ketoacyl-ACP synthase III [Rhodomicrobium vannielii ATCC 17100]MBJ7544649.1 ketoacyl-ACP synthase III [Rhodomicrobium udaipurense]
MKQTRSVVLGCGSYLPERVLTNQDLARIVDTSDEWISDRTGIKTRHIAADGEMTSDLGIAAARAALDHAGIDPQSLDFIILATSTPDNTFPSTATTIQAGLGLTHGFAFDVQAVCSGFAYALATADNFIRAGQGKRGLVIGAETFSRILDWEDRGTCVLFGDGAGAVVLEATQVQDPMRERCIIGSMLFSDGRHKDKLYVDGGPSSTQTVGHLRMQGKEVFRFAVNAISDVVERTLAAHNLRPSDIDWFVPHQANKRILDGTAKKVGIAEEKIVITLDRHGNTSAASIPLALSTAVHDGRIKRGDLVLFEAMGGGFTWGANLVRW